MSNIKGKILFFHTFFRQCYLPSSFLIICHWQQVPAVPEDHTVYPVTAPCVSVPPGKSRLHRIHNPAAIRRKCMLYLLPDCLARLFMRLRI